jgi:hypothetical protein
MLQILPCNTSLINALDVERHAKSGGITAAAS